MKPFQVYTLENCPYCERAKALLKSRGLEYDEIRVDRNDTAQVQALVAKTNLKTFPQIFRGVELVGGFSDLEKWDKEGKL